MKSLYLLIIIYLGLYLTGCAATSCKPLYTKNTKSPQIAINQPCHLKSQEKNPLTVAMFSEGQKPTTPYKILGTETISKFNYGGIKRQTASIHDAMRSVAAQMGGDAVINIAHDDKTVTATVIIYQNAEQQKTAA